MHRDPIQPLKARKYTFRLCPPVWIPFVIRNKAKVSKVLEFPADSLFVVTTIQFSTRYISIFDGSLSILRGFWLSYKYLEWKCTRSRCFFKYWECTFTYLDSPLSIQNLRQILCWLWPQFNSLQVSLSNFWIYLRIEGVCTVILILL